MVSSLSPVYSNGPENHQTVMFPEFESLTHRQFLLLTQPLYPQFLTYLKKDVEQLEQLPSFFK